MISQPGVYEIEGFVGRLHEAIDFFLLQMLSVAVMGRVRDCRGGSVDTRARATGGMLERPTFVQVSLKLIELALLQANLQLNDMIRRCRSEVRPLRRHRMGFLECVGRTNVQWRGNHADGEQRCEGDARQHRGHDDLTGFQRKGNGRERNEDREGEAEGEEEEYEGTTFL